jgi:glycine/D-amino acid oxidase-like deaminating enzyme/nitrite reductase/ring-hydroxylating ferredoxin subunit
MPNPRQDEFATDNGVSRSIWMSAAKIPARGPLAGEVRASICIVGAGIAGLTVAYRMARPGRKVIVLDDGPIAGGESCRTTAHLCSALDDRYIELERLHGQEGARLAAESHAAAVDEIERIVTAEGIQCDFQRLDGYLVHPDGDPELLFSELDAVRRAGIAEAELVDRVPIESFDFGRALRFPRQGQFHILSYLRALALAAIRNGAWIHDGTHVASVEPGHPARVVTAGGPVVTADTVLIATNTPVIDRVTMHTKQAAYRTYVVAGRLPEESMPRLLLWDTLDPYHYVRVQRGDAGYDYLIVGGEDHRTGEPDESERRHQRLMEWTRERFPAVTDFPYRWSGQVMEPVDGLGFIGVNPGSDENLLIATGDSGNGMTHGTIAGLLIPDLIEGRANRWAGLYDPARKTLQSAGTFARENLKVAGHYADLATASEVDQVSDIQPGEGAVVREGLKKLALYRDPSGKLHALSAICPHLGCVVHWNGGEKTWDCPCHGSRFHALGAVVNGPANKGLAPTAHAEADTVSNHRRSSAGE